MLLSKIKLGIDFICSPPIDSIDSALACAEFIDEFIYDIMPAEYNLPAGNKIQKKIHV